MTSEKEKIFFKIYQWTIVSFCLYTIIYVLVIKLLAEFEITFCCPYLKATGQECPLCGVTRDFWNILSFSTKRLNSLSNFIFYGFAMEVIYRGFIFIIWRKAAFWNYVRIISITDVSGHLIAILLFTALCLILL